MEEAVSQPNRIKHFPISMFSVILGMAGFTIAFQRAEQILQIPMQLSWYVLLLTLGLFGGISILYLIKFIKYRGDVANEFHHPIKLSFFPTFSISLLLLSIAFLNENILVSKYLWIAGAVIHFVFTLKVVSIWIQHTKFELKHMSPAWFIPTVGNILVPIAGVTHFASEISWFFFSIGLFLWIALFVIFFNRIIFHHPMPEKLLPTLFILIAPPAVGFISLVKLTGELNEFAKILYYFGLFLLFLLFAQVNLFKNIKFYLSWWAFSFPIAAITIASILMFHETHLAVFSVLSWMLFLTLNLLIGLLLVRTTLAVMKKEICVAEE